MSITHEKLYVDTSTRKTAYYRLGEGNTKKLILIHGNVSSGAFYLPLMEKLSNEYDIAAPDLNGYGYTEASPIKAETGLLDWANDVDAFAKEIGFNSFSLLGWSLGGGVAMRYAIEYSHKLENLILINPVSPFGFGGTYDEDGKMFDDKGIGCAGGFVNNDFLTSLKEKDRSDNPNAIRSIINNHYFKPGFSLDKELEDLCIDEIFEMQIGPDYYAGDFEQIASFPYALPGTKGFNNALAPQYCRLDSIADIKSKPKILWFRGQDDAIVSDASFYDIVMLGKIGAVPGYPGEDKMPPQSMISQTRYVMNKYKENGGEYAEIVIADAGHGCFLEKEDVFISQLKAHLK